MILRFVFFVLLAFVGSTTSAHAEDYVTPNWKNLAQTMVRFNALNLSDMTLLDEYAVVTECDLYKAFYHDDFKWHQVQQAITESVKNHVATFPTGYHFDVELQLDRYDFTTKLFRLTEKSTLRNVNTFVIYQVEGTDCGKADVKYLPRTYRAVLSAPFYIDGLPLSEKDAQNLLKQMHDDKNDSHIIYARFNLRIVYIDPLRKEAEISGRDTFTKYKQSNAPTPDTIRVDTRLESVDFYEDAAHTKLIFQTQI